MKKKHSSQFLSSSQYTNYQLKSTIITLCLFYKCVCKYVRSFYFRYIHMSVKPDNAYIYIYIVATLSFSFGLWGFIVGFKASLRQLQEFHYTPKIVTFQLCLVFLRLQSLIVNSILVPTGAIPCLPPLSPRVFANGKY